MANLLARIGYGARNVAQFSGRDPPGRFWPWTILVFILSTIAAFAVMLRPMLDAMIEMFRTIDALRPAPGEPIPPEVMDSFLARYAAGIGAVALPLAAINLTTVLLLAAAVSRRLHDCDRTALWGLLPLPFMAISVIDMPAAMSVAAGRRPMSAWETAASLNSAVYWLAVIALIVLLVGEGTRGPNRFGPDPREAR